MELQQIRAFVAVAEELHFGRAAERLGMAQPPLSRTIRSLETELGASLFQRTTRSVSLSPAGQALLEPAKHMLTTQQAAVESVHRSSSGEVGRVRFGYSHPSSRDLAATLVAASHERNPGITFHLESTVYADEGLERIMDGTLDLAPTQDGAATDLGFAMEIRGSMITRFMEPMIAGAAGGDIDASLKRLQQRFGDPGE